LIKSSEIEKVLFEEDVINLQRMALLKLKGTSINLLKPKKFLYKLFNKFFHCKQNYLHIILPSASISLLKLLSSLSKYLPYFLDFHVFSIIKLQFIFIYSRFFKNYQLFHPLDKFFGNLKYFLLIFMMQTRNIKCFQFQIQNKLNGKKQKNFSSKMKNEKN
jgi:hypothetical protein